MNQDSIQASSRVRAHMQSHVQANETHALLDHDDKQIPAAGADEVRNLLR